jgi:hypothetical protein
VVEDLPLSFADVVISGGSIRTEAELQERYGLPVDLASWYVSEAEFFRVLRLIRNGIAHEGSSAPVVFELPCGFAISPTEWPWTEFDEWPRERLWGGKLGSLRSAFIAFILHSLHASSRFAELISRSVRLLPPITDRRLFVRSPFGHWLVELDRMRLKPWEEPDKFNAD